MRLYSYFCVLPDGSPGPLRLRELRDDEAAVAHGAHVLAEHRSCDRVEIYEDERLVGAVSHAAP